MRVSLCTTTMNRLDFFSKTIIPNLEDNPDCEYVVLDYNSTDGTEAWVRDNLLSYIENGKLVYCKEFTATHFKPSHSRNMCMRLATGDILCNVDSDNYAGSGFAEYLARVFSTQYEQPKVIANHPRVFEPIDQGGHGRIALLRRDFYYWGGYCEDFIGWGEEDNNLNLRMMKQTLLFHREKIHWRFLRDIHHGDDLRVKHIDFTDIPVGEHTSDILYNKRNSRMLNKALSESDVDAHRYVCNFGKNWGGGTVIKNFSEEVVLESPWVDYI
jgi:glycosyltransferase involved in cell wall biosynthesis